MPSRCFIQTVLRGDDCGTTLTQTPCGLHPDGFNLNGGSIKDLTDTPVDLSLDIFIQDSLGVYTTSTLQGLTDACDGNFNQAGSFFTANCASATNHGDSCAITPDDGYGHGSAVCDISTTPASYRVEPSYRTPCSGNFVNNEPFYHVSTCALVVKHIHLSP